MKLPSQLRLLPLLPLLLILCACNAPQQQSATSAPLSPRVNHVMLYVSDLDKSIDFYTTAFDLAVTNRLEKLEVTNADGSKLNRDIKIAFLKFPGQDFVYELAEQPVNADLEVSNDLFQHVGIDVSDIEAAFKRVADTGAEVVVPVRTVRTTGVETKQAFFRGPDGELVELMQIISGEF